MGRINAMTSDYGSSRGAYIPNVPLTRPEMNPSQARLAPDQSNYALTEEEPSPMMGQTVPYTPGIMEPSVSQTVPTQDTSYFDSLPMDQKVNWVAYANATNNSRTYPMNQDDVTAADNYQKIWGSRSGILYDNAREALKSGRDPWERSKRRTNQLTSNQTVSNY